MYNSKKYCFATNINPVYIVQALGNNQISASARWLGECHVYILLVLSLWWYTTLIRHLNKELLWRLMFIVKGYIIVSLYFKLIISSSKITDDNHTLYHIYIHAASWLLHDLHKSNIRSSFISTSKSISEQTDILRRNGALGWSLMDGVLVLLDCKS